MLNLASQTDTKLNIRVRDRGTTNIHNFLSKWDKQLKIMNTNKNYVPRATRIPVQTECQLINGCLRNKHKN